MIYVITGVMASGKSTVAELLAREFETSVHLRGDSFRKMIASGREDMSEAPSEEAIRQLDLRYRLTAQAAKEYHAAGFTVVVQDNYYGAMLPRFLEMLAPEPVQPVVLCPDAEAIRQREAARPKTGYTGFAVEVLHRDFMAETPRIGMWIDNSRQTPQETVREILKQSECSARLSQQAEHMQLHQVTGRVYYSPHEARRDRPVLGYIRGERYSVMVDAGASTAHTNAFYLALSAIRLPMPEYTAITHWHWDHTFGMCAVNGKTVTHIRTAAKLIEMRDSEDVFPFGDERMRVEYEDANDIAIAMPDILFERQLVLDMGGIHCHIVKIPSPHSDDATAIWIPEEKVLFLGDANSPDYFRGGVYDAQELSKMTAWLEDCDFEICLLGHSEPLSKAELMAYLRRLQEELSS